MGISGLLPLLKSVQKPCQLKKFSGQTIGVDAYGWLHRGTVSCAIDLALGKPTTKFVDFAMHRVRMLLHFNITPYIVFDGDYLPSKSHTEAERRERRDQSKKLGLELLNLGKTSQAHLELQKAIDVTPEMARQLIEELKKAGVNYIVAPYEADSQLVYLERKGFIQGIISEDSDMLVFGAKCLLTKLDQYGECVMIHRRDFAACREVSLVGWTDADFRRMAILSGCDYLPSISNMGLKTAYRLLRKYKNIERLVKQLQWDAKFKVPHDYLVSFKRAELTFLYQWVWCPDEKQLVNLTEPLEDLDFATMEYIGSLVEPNVAMRVAAGDIHPHTKEVINLDPALLKNSKWPATRTKVSVSATPVDNLKGNKAIDTFFKPKRVPLAELDPNIFTPTPSQRRLLQHEPSSWNATPVPTRSATERRNVSTAGAGRASVGRTFSAPNPNKRQRLCSDDLSPSTRTSAKIEAGASRFFSPSGLSQTSSTRPSKSRSKSIAEPEFQLWSDDSIGEAMADLTETITSTAKTKKKLDIFRDDSGYSTASMLTDHEETQSTIRSTLPDPESTRLEHSSVFNASTTADLNDLRTKFQYQPPTVSTPISAPPSANLPETASDLPTLRASQEHAAAPDSEPAADESEIPESEVDSTSPTKSDDLDGSTLIDPEAVLTPLKLGIKAVLRDAIDLKAGEIAEGKVEMKGSEDTLVPDSEAESELEPLSPVAKVASGPDRVLDLARFAFDG
ncbi:PIN domain-like protein [Viridothelium virens]|uniref:PIN domain-like protein n=1 Tax=Viridothelium virens TaxID=1048519 RepID=A0A6A6H9S2_VIRVR|nr:PIN domain-like protein [Viridothelium virens]